MLRDIQKKYMTITMDVLPEGFSFQCWMSTEEFFQFDKAQFPFVYTHMNPPCTWIIRCNRELTNKVLSMAVTQADEICSHTLEVNNRRRVGGK